MLFASRMLSGLLGGQSAQGAVQSGAAGSEGRAQQEIAGRPMDGVRSFNPSFPMPFFNPTIFK